MHWKLQIAKCHIISTQQPVCLCVHVLSHQRNKCNIQSFSVHHFTFFIEFFSGFCDKNGIIAADQTVEINRTIDNIQVYTIDVVWCSTIFLCSTHSRRRNWANAHVWEACSQLTRCLARKWFEIYFFRVYSQIYFESKDKMELQFCVLIGNGRLAFDASGGTA